MKALLGPSYKNCYFETRALLKIMSVDIDQMTSHQSHQLTSVLLHDGVGVGIVALWRNKKKISAVGSVAVRSA